MDGLSFLERIMRSHPIPVVVVSSLTQGSNPAALRALALGAVEVVPKPGASWSVHLIMRRAGGRCTVHLRSGPPVHHQRPAVDVFFRSVARSVGADAVGVLVGAPA